MNPINSYQEPPAIQTDYASPVHRRARAGTVPSRFSPGGFTTAPTIIPGIPSTSRPSPAPSPFKSNSPQNVEMVDNSQVSVAQSSSSVASRLRSGSLNLPPRANYVSPFGPSIFASSWTPGRPTAGGNNGLPSSPAHSSFSKDDEGTHMAPKTLDYLGLVDSPQAARATLAKPMGLDTLIEGQRAAALQPFISDLAGIQRSNRIRSYSVNAKEKYAEDEEEEEEEEQRHLYSGQQSGNVTPSSQANLAAQAALHSLSVAYSPSRPRARTAGVLDSPPVNRLKSYLATPSRLDSMTSASDIGRDYFDLANSSDHTLKLGNMHPRPSSGEGGLASIEESSLEGPTRSLWLGNIPASTTTTSLVHIFQGFGNVESARVLTHKNCGFVNFNSIDSAVQARSSLNGKEIFPGAGPVRIGFAKPSSAGSNGTPTPNGGAYGSPSPGPPGDSAPSAIGDGALSRDSNGAAANGNDTRDSVAALKLPDLIDMREDIVKIVQEFGAEYDDALMVGNNIDKAVEYQNFEPEIPPIPEPTHNRVHDAPKLRDIRKRIDNGNCSQTEIEEIAMAMLDEIAELSSDYLGNTVVQKLFEYCSEEIKEAMLVEIGPHLAEIGIHKNGTWAGQKIIDVAKTPAQMQKICDCLRPYTVALFLDQYGNYVLQCCLRFGAPWNDFIFETMLSRMWEIAQGRFGARAMRACLESHHASKDQQRMLAAAIALHSVQLATNANGALLLTWFLDTCTFPRRRTVLAPRLVPHLVHLCTHKVAYLTVLKVINQRNEPEARDTILKALFFSPGDKVLEDILSDHSCGATLIFKVLTTPFFEETMRSEVAQNVRNVLLKLKATPSQGYKRLMDEVGLPTRNGVSNNANTSNGPKDHPRDGVNNNSNASNDRRGVPQNSPANHNHNHHNNNRDLPPVSFYNVTPSSFDPAALAAAASQMPQNAGFDPVALRAFEQLSLTAGSLYGTPGPPGINNPALQYQALLQQSMGRSGPNFFGMSPSMGSYNGGQASQDQYRAGHPGSSPVPQPQQMANNPMLGSMGATPGVFNPLQLMTGYPYGVPVFQPPQQQGHSAGSGRRGGRVSYS
ncbi:armadillo-type protein [Tuber indicum]|nr:armadillo-type protein [Tuber indicum]